MSKVLICKIANSSLNEKKELSLSNSSNDNLIMLVHRVDFAREVNFLSLLIFRI